MRRRTRPDGTIEDPTQGKLKRTRHNHEGYLTAAQHLDLDCAAIQAKAGRVPHAPPSVSLAYRRELHVAGWSIVDPNTGEILLGDDLTRNGPANYHAQRAMLWHHCELKIAPNGQTQVFVNGELVANAANPLWGERAAVEYLLHKLCSTHDYRPAQH